MERLRVRVNDVELEVNQYPRNGQTVLFLHFSSGNLAQWNGIVPYFMDRYHVVTLDLRGHGKSEKPKTGYTVDNMAKDVVEVMNHLGIAKAHIVGSSLGGEIALSLAANYPDRILSIVAEGGIQNYFGENGVHDLAEEEVAHKKAELRAKKQDYPRYNTISEKIEAEQLYFEQCSVQWNQQVEEFDKYNTTETADGRYTRSTPKWVMDEYLEDYWDLKFEKYFEKISCPVLMLPSEEELESESMRASIEHYVKLLKVNKVVSIPGGSHAFVAFQYPQEFSQEILDFYIHMI
ncbi:MAG: alpha/beta hydrolase [Paenibacillus sp.]|nr:alpha/beta hydrolase [Paenibacillus sp.]